MAKDQVAAGALEHLAARIKAEERQLWKLRSQMIKLPVGSDDRMVLALELTHLRTRLEALKEAWMILTGETF